ncbi:hypothetical protein DFJ73DRAFT_780808 [Zopfochytrium polystomum]|nr:hypothetical protein DFJ73DRAFT_780808 [Zopfochytrium polystomum]
MNGNWEPLSRPFNPIPIKNLTAALRPSAFQFCFAPAAIQAAALAGARIAAGNRNGTLSRRPPSTTSAIVVTALSHACAANSSQSPRSSSSSSEAPDTGPRGSARRHGVDRMHRAVATPPPASSLRLPHTVASTICHYAPSLSDVFTIATLFRLPQLQAHALLQPLLPLHLPDAASESGRIQLQ